MFPTGTHSTAAAESTSDSTPQHDRELLSLLMQGVPRTAHRLWRLHPAIFENGGARAELPPGWEQRVNIDRRVYFADHKTRTTTWAVKPSWAVSKSLAAWWEQFDKASLTAAGTRSG